MINEVVDKPLNSKEKEEQRFIIRPNASMSTKCAWIVFLGIIVLSTLVMIRFVFLGAWMVVPFALAEIAFIGSIFWLVIRSNKCIEIIILTNNELKIIRQNHKGQIEWLFQPYWSKVKLRSGRHAWYPDQLLIQSHGNTLEIGKCLTNAERSSLAKVLEEQRQKISYTS